MGKHVTVGLSYVGSTAAVVGGVGGWSLPRVGIHAYNIRLQKGTFDELPSVDKEGSRASYSIRFTLPSLNSKSP